MIVQYMYRHLTGQLPLANSKKSSSTPLLSFAEDNKCLAPTDLAYLKKKIYHLACDTCTMCVRVAWTQEAGVKMKQNVLKIRMMPTQSKYQ